MTNDIVAQYAQAGFCLFPLSGKRPSQSKDWTLTQYNPNLTRSDLPNNFGVLVGTNYLVIDIDVKNQSQGWESYLKLLKVCGLEEGWEETTFCVRTGSGGFHIYLKHPGTKVYKNLKEYPGIDFLTGNSYVVGAGSLHPESNVTYDVIFSSPMQILPVPPSILAIIEKKEIVEIEPPAEIEDDDPINIERFIETLAALPAAQEGGRTTSTYIAACRGRDLGLSVGVCSALVLQHYNTRLLPPLTKEEIEKIVSDAYKYATGRKGARNVAAIFHTVPVGDPIILKDIKWDKNDDGKLVKTLNNCVNHVATASLVCETFMFNTFNQQIEISSKAPWYAERGSKSAALEDDDETLLRYYLAKMFFIQYTEATVWDAITIVAKKRQYHPVKNYLETLVWDGKPRLDTWLTDYLRVEKNCYTSDVGRKVLCAGVKRIMEPGCKFDYVMILEGAQGAGKSTVVNILGRLWAGSIPHLDPHDKDSVLKMFGKWVVELSEMTSLRWADANALRAFFTNEKDTIRVPYSRMTKDYPRQSIFIGTVNPEATGYLTDQTGNRRYWIIPTPATEHNPIDFLGLENAADQLWAEAFLRYKTEQLFLTGESQRLQKEMADSRMPEEPYMHTIQKWVVDNPDENETNITDMLIYQGVFPARQTKLDMARMSNAFRMLGWERVQDRTKGGNVVVYIKPLKDRIIQAVKEE